MAKKKMAASEPMSCDRWEAEHAARSLMEAEKIRSNPKLYASAKKELAKMAAQAKKAAR